MTLVLIIYLVSYTNETVIDTHTLLHVKDNSVRNVKEMIDMSCSFVWWYIVTRTITFSPYTLSILNTRTPLKNKDFDYSTDLQLDGPCFWALYRINSTSSC